MRRFKPNMPLWAQALLLILGVGVIVFVVAAVIGCFTGESAIEVFQPDTQLEQEAPSDDKTNEEDNTDDVTDGTENEGSDEDVTEGSNETMSFASNGHIVRLTY